MLDCMATCRCMDKKPYDNILEDSVVRELVGNTPLCNERGHGIMESIFKSVRPVCRQIEGIDVGSAEISDSNNTVTSLLMKNVPTNLKPLVSRTFLVEPASSGRSSAPLSGN